MADRERSRSRSPERNDGGDAAPGGYSNDDNQDKGPTGDDQNQAPPPQGGGDGGADQNAGGEGEEVKLYVGNLDYGKSSPSGCSSLRSIS